jgi:hypothetical protein
MSRKRILTGLLVLPFVALASVAQAGPTITDKSYFPGAERYYPAPTGPYALERGVARPRAYTDQYRGGAIRSCTWTGGPKSSSVTCPR